MKKFFSALTALVLSICFISCMGQEISDSANSQKEVPCVLSLKNARTISPANGISYKNVSVWTVTFKDKNGKYDDIVKSVQFTEKNPTSTVQLPLGEFDVIFEGMAESSTSGETASTQSIPYYGESTVTVTATAETAASVSVFVAPKKTGTGKGSFKFTVTTSGLEDCPNAEFESKLITYPQGETELVLNSLYNSDDYSLSVTGNNIPSGFYQLSIKCIWETYDSKQNQITKDKEIYYPYYDFLVEIVDNCETSGSANIIVSLDDSKTYYATTDKTQASGNGSFISMPGYFDDVLTAINKTTISTANIIMVDEIDPQNPSYPEIDVSKVNATGKTYQIFTSSDVEQNPFYRISGAGEGCNPTINIHSSVTTVTLKNSLSSSGISGVANIVVAGRPNFVLEDNTSIIIDLTDGQSQIKATTIYMPDSGYNSYYAEHSCVTVKNTTGSQTAFDVKLGDDALNNSCIVVSNSSSDETYKTTNFYIIPSYATGVSTTGIPNYSLAVTKDGVDVTKGTPLYAGDTVVITATPADGDTFAQDTTFRWFVNGKQVEANKDDPKSCSIQFGVTEGSDVNNSIICLVRYGKEYATAKIEFNNVADKTRTLVLYNNTLDTEKSALSYATLTGSLISSPSELIAKDSSTTIEDYCFDASNNMYALVYDGINYSINKYAYNNGYSTSGVTTYTCSEQATTFDYIEASDDGKLYAVITLNTGTQSIVELTLTDPTEASANGTIGYKQYFLPTAWTSGTSSWNILTFCTDGTNFYVIAYLVTESDNTATAKVKLASCTVSDYQLTENENASIILDSITNQNRDTGYVFSEYSDSLEYRDLCYIENTGGTSGTLYLLVRDVIRSAYSDVLSSRGALCTFTVSDSGIQQGEIAIGYQTTSSTVSYTGARDEVSGTYPTITKTTYFGDGSSTFYGPVKFIARKEDELIIADEGYSVTEKAYVYSEGHKQGTVSSKNAVVTYNLSNLSEKTLNFATLDGEYFETKYSGYYYGSSFNN